MKVLKRMRIPTGRNPRGFVITKYEFFKALEKQRGIPRGFVAKSGHIGLSQSQNWAGPD